ncbi:MAG: aminoacyl-tRNA hydrolase [Thermoleophilia bacterium]|nr:aminoacyl-tRNA hydrolase [Thermoleophilia bacterium]
MSATAERVVRHLLGTARWTYSRSTGPGGQRRDHAETRAELTVAAGDLDGLPSALADRIRDALGLGARPLRLRCGTQRSRETNRDIVRARLVRRVEAALAGPPARRVATRPTRASARRRVEGKRARGATKSARGRVHPSDAD